MTESCLTDLLVELHVPDFAPVETFYGALGFTPLRQEPRYLVMRRGSTVINFYGGDGKVGGHSYFREFPSGTARGYGVELVIFVDDLDEAYEHIARHSTHVTPPKSRPWGCRDFRVADPFGYYLRVTERYAAFPPTGGATDPEAST